MSSSPHQPSLSSTSTGRSTRDLYNVKCGCGVRAPLRTALTEPNVGRRFLGCVNYKSGNACNFFDWIDPPTCERGKDFGNWIMKKNKASEEEIVALKSEIREFRRREEWLSVKINCMNKKMNEMEVDCALKMEEWKNKEDWNALAVEKDEDKIEELRQQMDEVQSENTNLKATNKKLKDKLNWLTTMFVLLVAMGVVLFSRKGGFRVNMLALP